MISSRDISTPDISGIDEITRRRMLGGSAAALALLLAGCSSAAKSANGGGGGGGASGGASRSLTFGSTSDIAPITILRQGTNTTMLALVFDTMATLDPVTRAFMPSVATGWQWNADKTQLTVDLRSDVRFHSGRAFGPEDAIFAIKAEQDPTSGAQVGGIANQIATMKVTGAHRFTITLARPISSFLDLLVITPLIDRETYGQLTTGKKVIGTGPFVFESWTPGTSTTLKRNPHYWRRGLPHLDAVTARVFGSEQALIAALRSDQIDLAWNLVPADAALLARGNRFPTATTAPLFAEWYVGANVKVAPLDDLRVRQAIAYAIDRDRIVKQAFSGFGEVSCVPWSTSLPGLDAADATHYAFDPERAKALLRAAGKPTFTLPLITSAGNAIAEAILNIVQYDLSKIGITVKPQQTQVTAFQAQLEKAGIPGLWINSVGQTCVSVPVVLLGNAPFKITGNTSNVTDPHYVALAKKVIYAGDASVASATRALTDYMLDQAWHMTVGHVPITSARSSELTGIGSAAGLSLELTDARLS